MVAAAMNTMEFGLRENDAFGGQRGISLMLFKLRDLVARRRPLQPAGVRAAPLAAVKANLAADPALLEAMVRRRLLDNLIGSP